MAVPMMCIMAMGMVMFQTLMKVFVVMPLGQMQPKADTHENACKDELESHSLREKHQRQHSSDEWSQGEICSCPRSTQMAKPKHEHHKAYADTKEPYNSSRTCKPETRQGCSKRHRKCDIDASRNHAFYHRDLHRVS